MSNDSEKSAKVLLKARPTSEQLRDRLAEPAPDGLELYLDVADISDDNWLATLEQRIADLDVPSDFDWVVEGPLRSLDGSFFDISKHTSANIEVVQRLVTFGRTIGAKAVVIHAIAPTSDVGLFSDESCATTLKESLSLLQLYADLCSDGGLIPTVENIPPVTRMRESRFMHSLIGMEPKDLLFLADQIEGLKVTLDVSHAQLYLNAASSSRLSASSEVGPEIAPLIAYLSGRREVSTLEEYIDRVEHLIFEAHFSNARGLLGEGLAYGDGELDLDRAAARLRYVAKYLVTETIEPDANKSILMREAQGRMKAALESGSNAASRGRI